MRFPVFLTTLNLLIWVMPVSAAFVDITSTPSGAKLFINGEEQENTPCLLDLDEGTYRLSLKKRGYETLNETLKISGDVADFKFTLSKNEFPLTIKTTPAGAKVRILDIPDKYSDGMALKNGSYSIEVSNSGFETWQGNVRIAGEAKTLEVSLQKIIPKYPLKVVTAPADAEVEVLDRNGRKQKARALKDGTYTLKVSKPGFETWSDKVSISGGSAYREVKLKKKLTSFYDSFDDNRNHWPLYNGTCRTSVEKGKFVIEGKNKKGRSNWVLLKKDFNLEEIDNFIIEARIKRTGGQDNYGAGLIFGSRGTDTGYRFEVDAKNGSFIFGTIENKKWKSIKSWTRSPHVRKGNSENRLTVKRVNGSILKLLVNDNVVYTGDFPSECYGQLGFVINYDVDIEVQDIAFREL